MSIKELPIFEQFIVENRLDKSIAEYDVGVGKIVANFKDVKKTTEIKQMLADFVEIDQEIKKIKVRHDKLSKDIKLLGTEVFDGADRYLTRVIDVVDYVATISAVGTSIKIDYQKIFEELVSKLTPKMKTMAGEILDKFSDLAEVAPKLSSVKKKKTDESVELDEGVMDVLKGWKDSIKKWFKDFNSWIASFDKDLAKIKKMAEGLA